jgi:CubicO group peptidase (beta-lactamase class C family)
MLLALSNLCSLRRPPVAHLQCAALVALLLGVAAAAQASSHDAEKPAPGTFSAIDSIMQQAVAGGLIPGGVVLIGHDGRVVYRKAFGSRSLEPSREAMTVDTIFDIASLTKCVATTTSVMQLIEQGKLRLNDPVAAYLPDFAQNGKKDITVRELLTHYSGLGPDLDLKQPWQGRDTAFARAMQQKPAYPPGSRFLYSDINFETLGFLVEKVSGMPLNDYAAQHIFAPLGMNDTRFLPPAQWSPRIAPTEYDEHGTMLRGVVHDPTARRMGGVAGHAGVFSRSSAVSRLKRCPRRSSRPMPPACAASAGTSIRPSPPTAVSCSRSAPSVIPASPAPRCGSIRSPTLTSFC